MPKVMVVFIGDDAAAQAESAAAGAKSIRFMEVDVRAAGPSTTRHKSLESAEGSYDGIVFVASDGEPATSLAGVRRFVNENTVLGSIGSRNVAAELASSGGIVVSVGDADASALGARVAKVAGWVRHALGHEAEGAGAHSHTHSHAHSHPHHDHKH